VVECSTGAQKEHGVSREIDKAHDRVAAGKDKKALDELSVMTSWVRTDEDEARGLFELASTIRARDDGRVRRDAAELVRLAERARPLGSPWICHACELSGCRVLECEAFSVSPAATLELAFTTEAVLVRSDERDHRLDYSEVSHIETKELFLPSSAKQKVNKAVLALTDEGWSAADEELEPHTYQVTLLTSRGRIVLSLTSSLRPADFGKRLDPVCERIPPSDRPDPLMR
jgi:hypothetical protein